MNLLLQTIPRCSLRTELRMVQALTVCGGMTNSIFPRIEALIMNDTDYQQALQFVAARKNMSRYQSQVDFLFCEIFTTYRPACFRFYLGNKLQLRDMIQVEQLLYFENMMLVAIEVAHSLFVENRCQSWKKFLDTVSELVNAA